MSPGAIQTFASFVEYFVAVGLIFDMIGAVIVLGPDLPPLARAATTWERHQLKRLASRIRDGDTLTQNHSGFEYLQTAVGQGHVEGATDRPFQAQSDGPQSLFWQFEEIEGLDDSVEIRNATGSAASRFSYEDLEAWVENFTGDETTYFVVGGFMLVSGFFFQFIAELATIDLAFSLLAFITGVIVMFYYWYKKTV